MEKEKHQTPQVSEETLRSLTRSIQLLISLVIILAVLTLLTLVPVKNGKGFLTFEEKEKKETPLSLQQIFTVSFSRMMSSFGEMVRRYMKKEVVWRY
jgi:hypothetical protein